MSRLSIVLTDEEQDRLEDLARRELRPTRLQAVALIREGLQLRAPAPPREPAAAVAR